MPEELALADRLHSAAIRLLRRLRRQDVSTGISAPQLSALSVIVFGGPLTLGELAEAEQVRPPTITRLVSTLDGAGLVVRESDSVDRRVVRVRATSRGREVLEEGRQRRVASLAEQLRSLEPEERGTLEEAAGILERLLQERV
ncbi:MAG: MarR family transcriptional regulator [Gemmatimonadota bacterium]|nr:MarR family transcriptional regulator [Gemmatimonadota bacterium]